MAYAVLGIDPGSQRTGWGIVREESGVLALLECGVIMPPRKPEMDFSSRLSFIFHALSAILSRHRIDAAAIEAVFTARNPGSALKLGQARGVAIAACAAANLSIDDYEPTLIKQAIVGTGRADKEQVAFMVGRMLNLNTANLKLDTTDALAVAICHLSHLRIKRLNKFAG